MTMPSGFTNPIASVIRRPPHALSRWCDAAKKMVARTTFAERSSLPSKDTQREGRPLRRNTWGYTGKSRDGDTADPLLSCLRRCAPAAQQPTHRSAGHELPAEEVRQTHRRKSHLPGAVDLQLDQHADLRGLHR